MTNDIYDKISADISAFGLVKLNSKRELRKRQTPEGRRNCERTTDPEILCGVQMRVTRDTTRHQSGMKRYRSCSMRHRSKSTRSATRSGGLTTRGGGGNTGTSTDRVKPLKFDGSASLAVFHRQFEAAADHKKFTSKEKAAYLIAVLQRQAADVLQCPSRIGVWGHRRGSEAPLWRQPAESGLPGATQKPESSWSASHFKRLQQPSTSWHTGPL
jgi:hypothetical protein